MNDETASFGFQDVPRAEKAPKVRAVFERVASRYDLMNDAMSGGMHRLWKDAAAAKINPRPGEIILDVAGGTGDIARRLKKLGDSAAKRRGEAPPEIHVFDINAEMLAAGRKRGEDGLTWACGDAEKLPVPDAFRRRLCHLVWHPQRHQYPAALADAYRVLKPGGRFHCLEFSQLAIGGLGPAYDLYSFKAIPALGNWLAKDADSYRYLVESIRRFPDQERFAGMIRDAGFARVGYRNMAAGVCALHWGWKV